MSIDEQKKAAAKAALHFVKPGMKLGLGTGSTAKHFTDCIGDMVKAGFSISCVPTSEATRAQAEALGIPLTTLDETPMLDLAVDGADEFDGHLNLIKGGGGALLREKIVAAAARQMIVIADASKQVAQLGQYPLPVEVVPFGLKATAIKVDQACRYAGSPGAISVRVRDGKPFISDNGNYILDCALREIADPPKLAAVLSGIPGVVEHGLFIGMARAVVIGTDQGVKIIEAQKTAA
jgi:ribose 5-phosphate isomerase A